MCSTKARLMILLAAGLLVSGSSPVEAAPGDIIKLGPGDNPQWSPDGKLISLICDGYLQVTPADGKGPRTRLAEYRGQSYVWSSDTEIVWSERQNRRSDTTLFKSVTFKLVSDSAAKTVLVADVAGPVLATYATDDSVKFEHIFGPVRLPDGAVGFYHAVGSIFGPVRFEPLRRETVLSARERRWPHIEIRKPGERFSPGWGALWLTTVSDSMGRQLTADEGFGLVVMAPTGDRFSTRSEKRGGFVILDTAGHELNPGFEPVRRVPPKGLIQGAGGMKWSPDGRKLCYLRTWDDGHDVFEMRLMVLDVAVGEPIEILGTDQGNFGRYDWSSDGTHIAVATEKSGLLVVDAGP